MAPYQYKHDPYPHQREALRRSHHLTGYALFMDPGTGKTYVVINNTVYLFEKGVVDGLLIIAPNTVHVNWISDELPKHVPERTPWEGLIWETGRMTRQRNGQKEWKPEVARFLDREPRRLVVLAMNFEAVLSQDGERFARAFLKAHRCVLAMDEADEYLASPGSKRFKRLMAFARAAAVRRPMTGTPVDESPLHAYGIMKGVNERFWVEGAPSLPTFKSFKDHIAITETREDSEGRQFPVITGWKNLDWLSDRMYSAAFRYRKDDLGLPPKRFQKSFVEMNAEQWRMYNELRSQMQTFFADGRAVTTSIKLTWLLRLQQIVCGYVPPDTPLLEVPDDWTDADAVDQILSASSELVPEPIPGRNYRLENMEWLVERNPGPTIVWCRFTPDVDALMNRFAHCAVRFDGKATVEERLEAKARYLANEKRARLLIGNPRTGGRGLTLVNTQHVIFYSNYFAARTRTQAEDRAHRIGLQHSVLYTDLCALKTVDTYIIERLRAKKDVARAIMRDPITEWI